jgi:hypothetical protein
VAKILIVYAYYETALARHNLGFFCRHGISPDRDRQHVIVMNGGCTIEDQIPKFENVRVLKRDNTGFDFGAWAHAFRHVPIEQFDYFFLLNSSVTGPFLPLYAEPSRWPTIFIGMLNDRVKLAGITINVFCGQPIVQSMFLVTDKVGLHLLMSHGIFTGNDGDATKEAVIFGREIRSSHIVLASGFRVDSLDPIHQRRALPHLQGEAAGDIFVPRALPHGHTLEPVDVCFFKTNRGCSSEALIRSAQLADYRRSTGSNRCFQDTRVMRTLEVLRRVPSAWAAHLEFAVWLTWRFLPQVIVDLGVDYGCSTYGWGVSGTSQVIGIDWFRGDAHTGKRDVEQEALALGERLVREFQYPNTVRIWKTPFDEAAEIFDGPIDILHIDGLHTSHAIKRDLDKWLPKLSADGIVVMHGTRALPDDVGKMFSKLGYFKVALEHSTGLGIASKSDLKIGLIDREWKQNLSLHGAVLKHAWFDQLCIQA